MGRVNIGKAIFAGFIGTLAMTALMFIKKALGIMPNLDPLKMLTEMAHVKFGLPQAAWTGWLLHFIMGSIVWGIIYAFVGLVLPGPGAVKGMIFGVLTWLVMMLFIIPLTGAGLFGLGLGDLTPVITLIMHLVYGFFLGWSYAKLTS